MPLRSAPASLKYTLLLTVLLVALLAYGISAGDPYVFVIAGVLAIFIGPLLVVTLLAWRRRGHPAAQHNGHDSHLSESLRTAPERFAEISERDDR
jgi:F0F1-type ATP synthase assembly protein I